MRPERDEVVGDDDASIEGLVSFVRRYGMAVLVAIPVLAVSVGMYRSWERASSQVAAFSQLTRDCLNRVLSANEVQQGVCEALTVEEFDQWQECVEDGKKDKNLTAYPFEPNDNAYSEAVQAVEQGK
jgi:hypothetical protein